MQVRAPDESDASDAPQSDSSGLEACMSDIYSHMQAGDFKAAAQAFKDALEVADMDQEPNEAPEPHSYDAQKEEA